MWLGYKLQFVTEGLISGGKRAATCSDHPSPQCGEQASVRDAPNQKPGFYSCGGGRAHAGSSAPRPAQAHPALVVRRSANQSPCLFGARAPRPSRPPPPALAPSAQPRRRGASRSTKPGGWSLARRDPSQDPPDPARQGGAGSRASSEKGPFLPGPRGRADLRRDGPRRPRGRQLRSLAGS